MDGKQKTSSLPVLNDRAEDIPVELPSDLAVGVTGNPVGPRKRLLSYLG